MVRVIKKILEIVIIFLCLTVFSGGIYYLIRFRPQPAAQEQAVDNAIVITTSDPFRLLVIYPNGQKTGFEPESGREFHDIPKSKYYFQAGKSNTENSTLWLGLTDNPDNFTLKISGETNQYYSFGIYVYRNNKQSNATFWGRIVSGKTASYQVSADPGKDFPLKVTQIK